MSDRGPNFMVAAEGDGCNDELKCLLVSLIVTNNVPLSLIHI